MKIHYLQHVSFENAGFIEEWAQANKHNITKTKLFENENLPDTSTFDLLVIMGGPMNIYEDDKYPWLKAEKIFISKCIAKDKKILGVCLGGQLIAHCLGGQVTKGDHKEIGWYEVEKIKSDSCIDEIFPEKFIALHWHGDTFSIPDKAIHFAKTTACENQAFIYKEKVIALQFHLEATYESLSALSQNCADEIDDSEYMQTPTKMLGNANNFTLSNALMAKILLFLNKS